MRQEQRGHAFDECRPLHIVLVRHGESVWNAWGKEKKERGVVPPDMKGIPDHLTPLTEWGREQARQTGRELQRLFGRFDVVYHSPYLRATETARLITEQFSAPVRLYRDINLSEQQFGALDSGLITTWWERLIFLWAQYQFKRQKRVKGKFYARPPGGESWWDVCLRTHAFINKLFRPQWQGKTIFVVTHAVPIALSWYHFHGRDEEETVQHYQEHKLDNCGIVHFRHEPRLPLHWELIYWNKVLWKEEK